MQTRKSHLPPDSEDRSQQIGAKVAPLLVNAQQMAQLGSWEWDIHTQWMAWSPEMFRIVGHEPDSIEPSYGAFLEHVHPEDRAFVERRIADALNKPSCVEFEYRVVRPDSGERTVMSRAEAVADNLGEPVRVMGTAQDVTEIRRFAHSLTSQVEQLQQLAQASVAIFSAEGLEDLLEVATGHAMRIVGAGRARGSIADPRQPGESLVSLYFAGEPTSAEVDLVTYVEPLNEPIRLRRNEVDRHPALASLSERERDFVRGGWLVVPLVDMLGGASGAIQLFDKQQGDFTETDEALVSQIAQITSQALQKARLFEELQASEDRYRRLFDAHLSGDFVVSPDGTFVEVNPALARILGYDSPEALKQVNISEVYQRPEEGRKLLDRIRSEGRALQYETEFLKADGTPIFVIINLVGVFDRDRQIIAMQGCLFDVTEWKAAEAALRESQQQLLQAQKMEAVGQLAGGIAHDFNNMLMAIQGFTNLLEEELPPFGPGPAHLAEIRKAADRSARLTRQLLAYSRKQVLQPEVMELNGIIAGMEDMLKRLIGEHIMYVSTMDPEVGRVHADIGQLQQVLMNLVLNARDAMPEGGRLMVQTGVRRLANGTHMGEFTLPPGEYAVLTVTDTGCGIAPNVLTRIFEPFFTTKPVGSGSGLGLSTVYGIVKQSGGYIRADSTPDEGTTFTIFLPRTEAAAVRSPSQPGTKVETSGTATVLVAEDESVLRSLAAMVLRRGGYTVLEAEDGMDALRQAEAAEFAIDVLVTDLIMPRLGGEALATAMLDRRPELRVVFMSGYAEDVIQRQGTIHEGAPFLEKPFAPHALLQTVQEILAVGSRVSAA